MNSNERQYPEGTRIIAGGIDYSHYDKQARLLRSQSFWHLFLRGLTGKKISRAERRNC